MGGGRPRTDRPDDFGNRAQPRSPGHYDDNLGNTVSADESNLPSEDIGNRLRPVERPIFDRTPRDVPEESPDDDDNVGNR
jgi:hypothetical protein